LYTAPKSQQSLSTGASNGTVFKRTHTEGLHR